MHITDLNAWRRVCLKAFDNLPANTSVTMADVDAVLFAGARQAAALDTSRDADAYIRLIHGVWDRTGVSREDVDAVLISCARDAAALLVGGHQ